MSKGSPRDAAKERFWRNHVRRWHASDLTVRDSCARHRLAEPSFYAWRRTLLQRDAEATLVELDAVQAPLTFVPLQIQSDLPVSSTVLELVLTDGRRLRIPAGIEPRHLRDLLAVLEEEPC